TNPPPTATTANLTPPDMPGMVFIPGGSFEMGTSSGNADEAPPHRVELSPYYLDQTEVTNEAYAQFVAETNYPAPTHWQQANPSLWRVAAADPFALGDPENRFDYGGVSVQPGTGTLSMTLNADANSGSFVATFTGTILAGGDGDRKSVV